MVFAAASNDGGNATRTYPAKHDHVFCIHSATGEGNKASFNPDPIENHDNFSVVGDSIESSWPVASSNAGSGKRCMSGTSFATPVAVSIAAFMIGYIKKRMPNHSWMIDPTSPEGMRELFRLMVAKRDGYDWISPQRYFELNEAKINADIDHALND